MPLFKGFRASLNLSSGKQYSEFSENASPVSINGAYKLNREEFYDTGSFGDPPKKFTPAMVKLPPAFQPDPTDPEVIRASKSTGDLTQAAQTSNLPPKLRKSTPEVSSDPKGATTRNRDSADVRKLNKNSSKSQQREQKKLEQKRLAEQKKREKLEAQEKVKQDKLQKQREKTELQERAKQEKLRKEREKAEAARVKKGKGKNNVPVQPRTNPLAQGPSAVESAPYNTNTLDSSISKASGPPPYTEGKPTVKPIAANNPKLVGKQSNDPGNISFGKPIDSEDTWDMVTKHRQQMNKAPAGSAASKVQRKQEIDSSA